VAATLDSDAIPVMDGALDLAGQGIRSSIWDDNAKISRAMTLENTARTDLLFDPQTAGGLLAAVAADQVNDTLRDLSAAGYMAARIGTLTAGPPHITVR
jgi:selenide,water dikinase